MAVQHDGKILVAGDTVSGGQGSGGNLDFALVRFTASGRLDRSFGSGGKVLTGFRGRSDDSANAVAVQRDGKIVAAGWSHTHIINGKDGVDHFALVRYTASGKLDTRFGSGGKVLTDLGGGEAAAMAVQKDGKIVVAGTSWRRFNSDFAVVRYAPGGQLDASFGSGGKVMTDFDDDGDKAYAVAVQADGKIVVAGQSSRAIALVRYTAKGSLDASFGSGGGVRTLLGTQEDAAQAVAVQADGKIIAAGRSKADALGSPADFALVRYMPAGQLDASFGSGGKVLTDFGGRKDDSAYAVAVQADGKIVAAGSRITGSDSYFALARYTK